ncbi:hypothetical protein Veis_3586 [Verminephrobacter eiseniae EF01-2]|uniref:Uncharacterized protein n=1 Tax=Verminephrobacter eiseniae (strain EF01-2) TaxID=391735 RepID=A1WNU7_VEREI|nr:hypothetical protein Veis_3586 [Verminephrobacter eiseniae EF01-2]MCW5284835.1 hypothetical protein [Verminephrobacter eiseniae]MCW5302541.1 hypothetical protein [Verminephrobacter eiseniae]MCW8189064.1 hypothetical protein [Verminephrobacter eiseniae]
MPGCWCHSPSGAISASVSGSGNGPAEFGRQFLVSRHRSSVGLRWPSKRSAALHRLPIRSVLAARCALRCAPMAARSLRHLIGDATLGDLKKYAAIVKEANLRIE